MTAPSLAPESTRDKTSSDASQRMLREQLQLLAQQTRPAFAGNIIIMLILEWAFWYRFEHVLLLGWGITLSVAMIARIVVANQYLIRRPDTRDNRYWQNRFMLVIGLLALAWALLPVLFFPANSPWLIMLMVVLLCGLTTAGIGSLSAYLPGYYSFAIPIMGAMTLRFFLENTAISNFVGLAGITFLASCLVWAHNLNKAARTAIELRFENLDLIDQLRQQKDAAEHARLEAEHANLAKSRFLAAASHDLRQPLHALGLYVSLLEDTRSPSDCADIIARIGASSSALETLFNALLDVSRLDADRVEVHPRHVPLMDLFERLDAAFRLQAQENGLQLRVVPTTAVLFSDPVLVERILRNLLCNAINYTRQGKVLLGCRRRGNTLRVEVIDTGPGIPPAEQERVFEEFHQLQNPERDRSKGLGLGLAIVRRVARLLDHSIELRSIPGHGSAFCLTLPAGDAGQLRQATAAPLPPTATTGLQGCTVLVIDDESAILKAMHRVLSGWGCRVLCADSTAQALMQINGEDADRPDLLLSDHRLREGQNGLDAIRAVRSALNTALPAILISGDTAPEVLRAAADFGCPLLHKPVKPARLRAAINAVLTGQIQQPPA